MTLTDDMRNGVKKPEMPSRIAGERFVMERVNPYSGDHMDYFKNVHADNSMRRDDFARKLGIRLGSADIASELQDSLKRADMSWKSYGFGTYVVKDTERGTYVGAARLGYEPATMDVNPRLSVVLTDQKLSQYVTTSREARAEIGFGVVKAATEIGLRVHCTDREVASAIGMQELGGVWANPYFDTSRASHKMPAPGK